MQPSSSVRKQSESTPGCVPGAQGGLSSSASRSHLFFFKQVICPYLFYFYNLFYFIGFVGLYCCAWAFSSGSEWGLLFVVVHGFLIMVASLGVEHRLQARELQQLQFPGLQRAGSVVEAQGLSCSTACEIFPDQGLNPVSRIAKWILNHWITREVPTSHFLRQVLPSPHHPGFCYTKTPL